MSSIVTELLQSTGKLAKENIVSKVGELKRKVEILKLEIQETLKSAHSDLPPQYVELQKFIGRLEESEQAYEQLNNQIEKEIKPQIMNSVAEFHDVLGDLNKAKSLRNVLFKLVLLHQHLNAAKDSKRRGDHLSSVHHLLDYSAVFEEIDPKHLDDVAILKSLKTEYIVTRENIIYDIQNVWKQNVTIDSQTESKNRKRVIISVSSESTDFGKLLKSLYLLKSLRAFLREFGKQFLKSVCEVLVTNSVKVSTDNVANSLKIDILNEQSPQPCEVFETLRKVFTFVHTKLFAFEIVTIVRDDENVQLTAMNELGAVISEDFYSLIIEKCLKTAIPKQSKQLEAFNQEIISAENFCNLLLSIGFCTKSNNSLKNFIKNVDILPINKMTQDVLSRARTLMQKSLHQTVVYGVESSSTAEEVENSDDLDNWAPNNNRLSKATFLYPRCQISASMKELVKLLKEVKDEAKYISHSHAPRLYYVARRVCELYCSVVPTFHKEEIQNIPQQTAIFHNNCMYLAHELCCLGSSYECDLQSEIPMTFVDFVPEIKKLGTEAFLHQMRHQKQLLLQLIQEQRAYQTVMIDEELILKAEKSIKQCLCQLHLLKKVWSEVLPTEIYFKAIGTLLNSCLEEIILRVLSMEDISADAATQMDSIFSILVKQGPDLFKVEDCDKRNFVHLYVKQWFKFQELQLILDTSMKEIVDRWASGKGPLAAHFSSDEVKHLIRALFQNTERRAAALAKIR